MSEERPRRRKRGWMNLQVSEIIHETHDTDTFVLVDKDDGGRPFDYKAGQYLTFRFDHIHEKPIVRSYTMSSSPRQEGMSAFTVKRIDNGIVSNWLCDHVKVGDVLRARGPIGKFCYDPEKDHPHLVMVAGGSGVTPFVSIIREYAPILGQDGAPQTMTLLVSYRTREDLICWKELMEAAEYEGVSIYTTLTRENATDEGFFEGRMSDSLLQRVIQDRYENRTFMTCGPDAIMDLTVAHLKDRDVDPSHIKTESFES